MMPVVASACGLSVQKVFQLKLAFIPFWSSLAPVRLREQEPWKSGPGSYYERWRNLFGPPPMYRRINVETDIMTRCPLALLYVPVPWTGSEEITMDCPVDTQLSLKMPSHQGGSAST